MNYLEYIKKYQSPASPLNQFPTMPQDTTSPLVDKQQYERIYDSNSNIRPATDEEREQMNAYDPNASHIYGMEVPAWAEAGYSFIPVLGTSNQVYRATQTGDPKDWALAAVSAIGDIPGGLAAKFAVNTGKALKTTSRAFKVANTIDNGVDTVSAANKINNGYNLINAFK